VTGEKVIGFFIWAESSSSTLYSLKNWVMDSKKEAVEDWIKEHQSMIEGYYENDTGFYVQLKNQKWLKLKLKKHWGDWDVTDIEETENPTIDKYTNSSAIDNEKRDLPGGGGNNDHRLVPI